MNVVPLPPRAEWLADVRDGDRALRVSWHDDEGFAVLSTWRGGECTASARLGPGEVARLVAALTDGLATAAGRTPAQRPAGTAGA